MKVHADADALHDLARTLESTADVLGEHRAAALVAMGHARLGWSDGRGADFQQQLFEQLLPVVHAVMRMKDLAGGVRARAHQLDGYLGVMGSGGSGPRSAAGRGPPSPGEPQRRSVASAAVSQDRSHGAARIVGTVPGARGPMTLVDVSGLRGSDIDWASGEDFPARFPTDVHHSNTADTYRRWNAAVPRVVAKVQNGEELTAEEDQIRSVYLGSEPVRLVLQPNGRLRADDQHRVMAAIEAGSILPVWTIRE